MNELTAYAGLSGIPVVVALVQITKPFVTAEKFWPVLSLVYGIAWTVAVAYILKTPTIPIAIGLGFVVGLSASGAYSINKTRIENTPPDEV